MVIYLDNNATTKVDERVLDAMLPFLKEEYANPSSMYEFSVKSSNAIADARVKMKEFLGAKSEKEIIFNVKVDEFEINSQLKQSMFGKTVFLTQDEAEEKLKGMKQ